jgi:hypothetical protein
MLYGGAKFISCLRNTADYLVIDFLLFAACITYCHYLH